MIYRDEHEPNCKAKNNMNFALFMVCKPKFVTGLPSNSYMDFESHL